MTTTKRHRIDTPAAILWASAFLLGGLVLTQAARLPANPAYGSASSAANGFSMATVYTGRGSDESRRELLFVIDDRAETLLVYEIEDARRKEILLRGGGNLQGLFARGAQ